MADTAATVSIQAIVKRFILKYKVNEDDFVNYLEHAADCLRDLNISHLPYFQQSSLTLDSVGKVAFPTDMIDFISVGVIEGDVYYTFIQSPDLSVPTSATTYSGTDYDKYYYHLDWPNRYIYCQTLATETITLRYVSSGISTSVDTLVPIQCTQVIDAYLRWMQALMDGAGLGQQQLRKQNYEESIRHLQWQQLPTLEQFKDTWLGVAEDDQPLITTSIGSSTTSGSGDMNSYSTTTNLSAGSNTITTTVPTDPIAISVWDSLGNEISTGLTINATIIGGVVVLTIYSVDPLSNVEVRVAY